MAATPSNHAYRKFSAKYEAQLPLFLKDWWLDAVAPQQWSFVHYGPDDDPIAVLPFLFTRRGPFTRITNVRLCTYGGPFIIYPENQTRASRIKLERKITENLINQLPKADIVVLQSHPDFNYWQSFLWEGYQVTPRTSYVIPSSRGMSEVEENLHTSIRQNLRKVEDHIKVRTGSVQELMTLADKTFAHQNEPTPYSAGQLKQIVKATEQQEAIFLWVAVDDQDKAHAATLFLMDKRYLYYFKAGSDPQQRSSGAQTLLIWKALEFAAQKGLDFNFLGSINPSIELFMSRFGPIQSNYYEKRKVHGFKGSLIQYLKS